MSGGINGRWGKERILRNEEDQSMLNICMLHTYMIYIIYVIMNSSKHFENEGRGEGDQDGR
jgi:hypothetical protein